MLISPAYAQAGGAPGGFDLISLMPLLLIFVVFYFLLIRPQQKKMKQHRDMIGALKRGDRVLTAGGIIGTVVKVEDAERCWWRSPRTSACGWRAARSPMC